MPVTLEENKKYADFVGRLANEIGVFEFKPDDLIWHYTDGPGFLGIIQTGTIFATQVASTNDKNETKYATDLFKGAVRNLLEEKKDDEIAQQFLNKVLKYVEDNPTSPTHGTSKFFVSCFSGEEDDLTQWTRYGKKNGYAIGFYARGFFRSATSSVYKVVYDREKLAKASKDIAEATLAFYFEGLKGDRVSDPDKWAEEFFAAWDEWIYRLAPLAKAYQWRSENEFRLVHELNSAEFSQIRFRQLDTMLARYLPISTPMWLKTRTPLLPIGKVLIGPNNHPAFTRVSVALLLEQMGYSNIPIEVTQASLQIP